MIDEVQAERGKHYGAFIDHATAVDNIMSELKQVRNVKGKGPWPNAPWPKGFETALFYMVSKMVRMATSPEHEDSVLDLSSYADLWLKVIKENSDEENDS